MSRLLAGTLAALCAPLAAQADHFTTSPEGYNYTEGNSHDESLLGTEPLLRFQQIDATNNVNMFNRNQIAFRRDGRLFMNPDYKRRTLDLEVVFAESDLSNISTTFAANFKTNMSVVVARKTVNLMDWIVPPSIPPAVETNAIVLDNIWSYAGKAASGNDFLWEIKVWSNSEAGKDYPFDFDYVVPNASFGPKIPTVGATTNLSAGCLAPGQFSPHRANPLLLNYGDNFEFRYASVNGPSNQAVVLFLGTSNANFSVPFLCNPLHAITLSTPIGVADGNGQFTLPPLSLGYNGALIGQKLIAQEARLCGGCFSSPLLDLSLSNGVEVTFPTDPPDPLVGRVWALDPNATTATQGPLPGGIIIYTNHL